MSKHKAATVVEPPQGMTLAEAQAEDAAIKAAETGDKTPEVRYKKDGTPYAERGPGLKWTTEEGGMDDILTIAVRDNPGSTGQEIAEMLWNSDVFAEVIGLVTGERVRARVAYLRKAGVLLGRLGRSTVKPDVAHLNSLLGVVVAPEAVS